MGGATIARIGSIRRQAIADQNLNLPAKRTLSGVSKAVFDSPFVSARLI
jgi:hypothetical protein